MKAGSSRAAAMVLLAASNVLLVGTAPARGWKPERNVELTVPSGPRGSNDIAGRIIQKLWTDLNLLPVSSSITEPMIAVVRADSPIKTGALLLEALKVVMTELGLIRQ